ncbi:hypothetical protein [Neisseria montereyensis]|uniref:Uncharacterized protein n=1 Tax=Neisseria montereyensis TaxID=2973938 RepID=A0ABT2FDM6_9NEIS|nr:hypothetical protein [Neisseria montereyensis]MCS4534235.1 hypothetical protein [Neisseria montereyensis]
MLFKSRVAIFSRPQHEQPLLLAVKSHVGVFSRPRHPKPLFGTVKSHTANYYGRTHGNGFIAGRGDGILTVGGQPAERRIILFERGAFQVVRDTWSRPDGTYLLDRLNPDREYLVLAVDHKKQYEPVAYDFVRPAVPESG